MRETKILSQLCYLNSSIVKAENANDHSPIVNLLESARLDLEQFRRELGHEEMEVHKKYLDTAK